MVCKKMSTKEKSHKEQLTQDESISLKELFEPDESIKPHTLEDLFTPDEITEFFELKELFRQDDQFEQDGPIKLFRPDGKVVEIELDKLVPFGNHSFKLFQGRLLKEKI